MTDEERRALLGDDVIAHIREVVDAAPEPTPELVEELRRFLRPAVSTQVTVSVPDAA
jgi:hypothetical protein